MDQKAIAKARARLQSAERTYARLAAETRSNVFAEEWYQILVASKNVWTLLEKGSKATAQSRQWMGGKKAERRSSALLAYMFEARNDDEHGLDQVVAYNPGGVMGYAVGRTDALPPGFVSTGVRLFPDGSMALAGKDADGKDLDYALGPTTLKNVKPHMQLMPVRGLDGRLVQPPPLDPPEPFLNMPPLQAARQNLDYLTSMVEAAAALAPS